MERLHRARVEPGRVAIHWLGQSGFGLKSSRGDVILIDPFLSSADHIGIHRLIDPPIRPRDVKTDYLFLTHDHMDHTDPHTAPLIAQANPTARIVCPPSSAHRLTKLGVPSGQITVAMPGNTVEFPRFTAHVVPAIHTEDSVGFVFALRDEDSSATGVTAYFMGDTSYSETLAESVSAFEPDVLIAPLAGPSNLDVATAARVTTEIRPREVIPMHYGMFAEVDADPEEFKSLVGETCPETTVVIMKVGECHLYSSDAAFRGKHGQSEARSERARQAQASHEHRGGGRPRPSGRLSTGRLGGRGR